MLSLQQPMLASVVDCTGNIEPPTEEQQKGSTSVIWITPWRPLRSSAARSQKGKRDRQVAHQLELLASVDHLG